MSEVIQQYVDWLSLEYYDRRIKDYIQETSATRTDQYQIEHELEQLENLLSTLTDNFTTDKKHIYEHIEACRQRSATKDDLEKAILALREEIKTLTGVDLSDYATIAFVEARLREIEESVNFPDNLVTRDELQEFATKEELVDEISKIKHPTVDLSGYAKKEDIPDTSSFLTSVPSEYVTEEELEEKGYLTDHQSLAGLATEEFVRTEIANAQLGDTLVDLSQFVTKTALDEETAKLNNRISDLYVIQYGTF